MKSPAFIRHSILAKVTLIILAVSTLTLGTEGVWEYKNIRAQMTDRLKARANLLAERLALGFVKIVWDYDYALAKSVIRSEMKEKSISGILVWEKDRADALFGGWRLEDGRIMQTRKPLSGSDLFETERTVVRNDVPIGRVRVFLTDRYLNESLRSVAWTTLARVLVMDIVIILLLIILIRSYLIRPMSNIRYAMKGLEEGILNQRVSVDSSDEIGQIAESFNLMAEQLNKREKELSESEEKFSTLVRQAADALFLHDLNGRLLDVNESACISLGYTRRELMKLRVGDVDINFSNRDALQGLVGTLRPGVPKTLESEHRKKDGSLFPVEVRVGGIQIHGEDVFLAVVRDISERKHAEIALKNAHDELELKVAERTSELSIAKDQAEAANAAKSEFLARMSHEIRTPLSAVTGLSNILLKSELSDGQRDYLKKIQIASNNLKAVINDILDFSKVEAGQLELANRPMDLDQLLEQMADLFIGRVSQKDIELLFDVAPQVPRQLKGDADRLTQVLTNLIENAVKFTDAGEIVVKAALDDFIFETHVKAVVRFSIRDSGIGIAQEVLETLFDPFTQADSSLTRKHEGTGLGLAICQRLVALMGGQIGVESKVGQGSTFWFTVTLCMAKEQKPVLAVPDGLKKLRTLVVDDSPAARQMMATLLDAFTFTVKTTDTGYDAIEKLRRAAADRTPYQLVLIDWNLPGMDGVETVRAIRAIDGTAPLSIIIMVSAYGMNLIDAHHDKEDVDGVLIKPIKPSLLYKTIVALFGGNAIAPYDLAAEDIDVSSLELRGNRILVVEDSPLNVDVVKALLDETGMKVEIAVNGKDALDKIEQSLPGFYDAVLMDIQMPVMDGYEATQRIRSWETAAPARRAPASVASTASRFDGLEDGRQWQNGHESHVRLPIIALTAHALEGERIKCIEAGMDDYLAKPIDVGELHRALRKWIKPRSGEVEAL